MNEVQIKLFRTARHMRRGKILIASLRSRTEDMRTNGRSIDRAETMLKTFEATQRMLQRTSSTCGLSWSGDPECLEGATQLRKGGK